MGQRLVQSIQQFVTSNSVVLAGGTCSIFEAGTTTLIPLSSDVNLANSIDNPFTYDAAGMAPDIFYADAISIKQEIKTSDGSLFRTADDIPGRGGPTAGVSIFALDQTYVIGEEVVSVGIRYTSNIDPNKGNTPTEADSNWTRSPFQGVYNANFTYVTTDRVVDPATGILFISRVDDNTGNTPSTNPTQWANGSSVGIQTVNIPGGSTNIVSGGPQISSVEIGDFIVVTRECVGALDKSVQFYIKMPESWDQGPLQALFTIVSRTAVAGGTESVWGISAVGFDTGETITSQTFGPDAEALIEGITTQDNFYGSALTTFIPSNVIAPKSDVYFKVTRLAAVLSTDFLALDQTVATGNILTLETSNAAEIQQVPKQVTLTSGDNLSGTEFSIVGTSDGTTVIAEGGIVGPNVTTLLSTLFYATVTSIEFTVAVAASTVEAGYQNRDTITSTLGLENVVILYNTVSSTDNA